MKSIKTRERFTLIVSLFIMAPLLIVGRIVEV